MLLYVCKIAITIFLSWTKLFPDFMLKYAFPSSSTAVTDTVGWAHCSKGQCSLSKSNFNWPGKRGHNGSCCPHTVTYAVFSCPYGVWRNLIPSRGISKTEIVQSSGWLSYSSLGTLKESINAPRVVNDLSVSVAKRNTSIELDGH